MGDARADAAQLRTVCALRDAAVPGIAGTDHWFQRLGARKSQAGVWLHGGIRAARFHRFRSCGAGGGDPRTQSGCARSRHTEIGEVKLPRFDYASPATVQDVVALLAESGGSARLLAGGQSLIPMLAFRLAAPTLLIDLGRVAGLDTIDIGDSGISLGARVRWCDIEADRRLASLHPLLAAAVTHVAHYAIRKRGTVGGSLGHADPAAELPGIAVTCGAELTLTGPSGTRTVPADAFIVGPLSTVLAPDELITQIRVPSGAGPARWGVPGIRPPSRRLRTCRGRDLLRSRQRWPCHEHAYWRDRGRFATAAADRGGGGA